MIEAELLKEWLTGIEYFEATIEHHVAQFSDAWLNSVTAIRPCRMLLQHHKSSVCILPFELLTAALLVLVSIMRPCGWHFMRP